MEIDNLEIRIESEAKKALANLDNLSAKLDKISASLGNVNSGGLNQFANGINQLSVALNAVSGVKTTDFTRLAKNIEKLSTIDNKSINRASGAIRNIASSLNQLSSLQAISNNLANLASGIAKLGYKTSTNAIANIPKLASAMKELMTTLSSAPKVSDNVIKLTNALANLASQGSKVKTATNGLANGMNSASNQTRRFSDSARTASASTLSLMGKISRLIAIAYTLRRVFRVVWKSIGSSMDYVETINLFQTALKKIGLNGAKEAGIEMGSKAGEEYAINFMRSAEEFSENISNKLGLDPNLTKNYQATFAQITNAMGNTAITADNVSRSFTMLGNDIASLWNISTDSAMQKLQAGLAGQAKPLRELGIDITTASLQQTAYNYGIETSVSKMSQAAKVQLRYLTIMRQSSVAFGDMAKTISSPANQLRILKQQWDLLCRSIGNVFLPLMQTVVPVINGLVIALRRVVDSIAAALGYETPDYSDSKVSTTLPGVDIGDYGDTLDALDNINDGYSGVGKSANNAAKEVEKFKKVSMGFDQFNIIQNNLNNSKGSGGSRGSSGGSSGGGGYSKLDDAIGDATNGYMQKFNEELAKMSDEANKIADVIQPKIEAFIEGLKKFAPAIAGVAAAFATYKLVKLFEGLGTALTVLGSPEGIIALVAGALVFLGIELYKCWKKARDHDLAKRFGDITLSSEELEKVAKRLVDNGNLDKLQTVVSSWKDLDETSAKIKKAVDTLNKLNVKLELGLTLTEEDEKAYKDAIDSYIKNVKKYADDAHLAVDMTIDLLVKDKDDKKTLLDSANTFFNSNQQELEDLGKKLKKAVDKGWKDGKLELDEAKEIQKIQEQMASIQQKLAEDEFAVKMKKIELTYSAIDLTPKCAKELMKDTTKAVQDATDQFNEVTARLLVNIDAQAKDEKVKLDVDLQAGKISYEEYNKKLNDSIAKYDLQREIAEKGKLENIGEITLNASKVDLNTITRAFEKELKTVEPDVVGKIQKAYEKWISVDEKGKIVVDMDGLTTDVENNLSQSLMDAEPAAKSNMQEFLNNYLSPKTYELEQQAKEWLDMGYQVPDNIAKGIGADIYLQAVTGNIGYIYALMSTKMTNSKDRTDMLNKAKQNGFDMDTTLFNSIVANGGLVNGGIDKLIGGMTSEINKESKDSIKAANTNGKDLGTSYASGIDSKQKTANTSGKNLVGQSKSGIEDAMQYEKGGSKLFKNYGGNAADSFINMMKSKSDGAKKAGTALASGAKNGAIAGLGLQKGSSTVFSGYGKNTVDGFNTGLNNNKSSSVTIISNWASSVCTAFKNKLGIHSPSKIFGGFAVNTVDGYNNSIEDNMQSTKSVIGKWGETIKNSANGFSVAPLNMESNYSVNTKGLEGYSDLISGNVNVGGDIQTTTTQVIQGIGEDIYNAVRQAISEIPSKDTIMYVDGVEVARSVNKHNVLENQRYSTVLV